MIPRFPPTSLTTPTIRWLHEEAWDDRQKAAFFRLRVAPAAGLFAPLPPLVGRNVSRRPGGLRPLGRWLLETAAGEPLASAEGHAQVMQFTKITLLLSDAAGGWAQEPAAGAVSLLISGVTLLSGADLLRLVPLDAAAGEALKAAALGEAREVWSPYFPDAWVLGAPAGLRLPTITIDPHAWWTTDRGARDRKILAYLEKRVANEADQARPARPRPLGVLSRISRLLRWS
jgi:hypothetical protein